MVKGMSLEITMSVPLRELRTKVMFKREGNCTSILIDLLQKSKTSKERTSNNSLKPLSCFQEFF